MIGRIWFHIPIEEKPDNAMPCALVAVVLPERVVLAHEISTDQNSPPSIQKMLRKLADRASNHGKLRKILMDPIDHAATRLILKRSSTAVDDDIKRSTQRVLAQAFGDKMGNLLPIYRPGAALSKPKYNMGTHDRPLTPAMATAVIEQAIVISNMSRSRMVPYQINVDVAI